MPLKSLKKEILQEYEAAKITITLAAEAQKQGYTKTAKFFLKKSSLSCFRIFLYTQEIDRHYGIDINKNIIQSLKEYYSIESGTLSRIHNIQKEAFLSGLFGIQPFIEKMLTIHAYNVYHAQKLLQNVLILLEEHNINDINNLFYIKKQTCRYPAFSKNNIIY
ncbi:MAG: hypothetical protein ACRCTQ_04045 [Brevinemataceae bacterium]